LLDDGSIGRSDSSGNSSCCCLLHDILFRANEGTKRDHCVAYWCRLALPPTKCMVLFVHRAVFILFHFYCWDSGCDDSIEKTDTHDTVVIN
jgi:hypothetical protein